MKCSLRIKNTCTLVLMQCLIKSSNILLIVNVGTRRYLVCNTRRITVEDDNWRVEKDVITMIIRLENTESTPEIYGENQPMENVTLSTCFFPHVSPDYVAA